MTFRWKKIYETGIPVTDQWNKKLVNIINKIYTYILTDTIIENKENIIKQMISESISHFSVEKELFEKYKFTSGNIKNHIEEHNFFVKVLEDSAKEINSGDILVLYKLADFLRSWIVKHMLGSDKQFALFARKKNHFFHNSLKCQTSGFKN